MCIFIQFSDVCRKITRIEFTSFFIYFLPLITSSDCKNKTSNKSICSFSSICVRRVWRYQRGNQNPSIEEEQTTQWPKAKGQKDKQRSTKHTHKTKDWVTRTPLKTEGELRCSGRVSISCSTSGTRHVNLVPNLVISHEWGKDQEVLKTIGTYP